MSILEDFVEWHNSIKEQVSTVTKLAVKPLSDEPEQMIKQLEVIESWNSRVGFLLADANGWLDKASMVLRPGKEVGSEADRKAQLEGTVSPIRVTRDKLESLLSCIKQRLILGESLLAFHRQFANHQVSEKNNQENA